MHGWVIQTFPLSDFENDWKTLDEYKKIGIKRYILLHYNYIIL